MALQILNLSTDAINFQPMGTSSATVVEYNDLNTLVEYFAEVVLGKKNAFPENLQHEEKQSQVQKHITIKLFNQSTLVDNSVQYTVSARYSTPVDDNKTVRFAREITPPPPKA
ncbi:hypothetical protein [Sediminibacterium ginsengisoli]|nr:hypothetical protein [Sediminibacterium ginsengisoli]